MLQILLGEDSSCPKIKKGKDSPTLKFIYLKIRRRDGVKSLTTLEEGKFKVPIDGCISRALKAYISPLAYQNITEKQVFSK